ncbi:MAG: MBL fold metallo-hydrolase [Solirubrobacterales bacterium]|nr:MBL fold metallo-hydrolase [Solirubrobacterales bacterium]
MSAPVTAEPIDVLHLGRERVICTWRIGSVIIDPGPASCADTLEAALGGDRPEAILLTHIHLDHSGGTGELLRRWPGTKVFVHELGARHLIDPSRLLASASQLYGDLMQELWGDILPVPEEAVTVLAGGETIDLEGGFEVIYTPGHAKHHVSYLHRPTMRAFVGDTGGVRIGGAAGTTIAPTPPPDIDVELWNQSLDAIAAWEPSSLCLTHFGEYQDVDDQIAALRSCLGDHVEMARELGPAEFADAVRARLAKEVGEENAAAYFQAAPPDDLQAGLARYWMKRAEAEGSAG